MAENRTVKLPVETAAPVVDLTRPHFVGIGGAGMSGLAQICAARGAHVSGSDTNEDRLTALAAAGCAVHTGHDPSYVRDASCVVISTAIPEDNPEVAAANAAGIPVAHRAQILKALMDDHTGVAVSGTHGKSSTSAMLATILTRLGREPSYAIGAELLETGSNARHGNGGIFVAEADESDRSFCWLRPDLAVVLNIDDDHPENYASLADHLDAYAAFAGGVTAGGTVVINADDATAPDLADRLRAMGGKVKMVTYGAAPGADWSIREITRRGMGSHIVVTAPDGRDAEVMLMVPGRHMARNAVAALAAASQLGVGVDEAAAALSSFGGVARRFTSHGHQGEVQVYDSFAHHPTAISADLETARALTGSGGRVLVVFQPCGYARTLAYGERIATALARADIAVLLEIHGSVGDELPGVSSQLIAQAIGGTVSDPDDAVSYVSRAACPGDVVLTMGTGNVTMLGRQICAAISAPELISL